MENSSIAIYLSQFAKILADPVGIMALVAMLGLAMLVVVNRLARWLALTLAIFAIACSLPADKYMTKVSFLAPLQFFRVWSRPITFVALLMLMACAVRFDRGVRQRFLPASFWLLVTFQVLGCFRLILVPSLVERGMGALGMIVLLVGIALMTLAPGIQSLQEASRAVYAVAGCALCFIGASLLQYAVDPTSVVHNKRLFGIAGNPQYASYLLAMALPSMCYLFIRRKQGIWITVNLLVFGLAIPAAALMLMWTGSRGGVLTAMVGVIVFFHRRLGRFVLAGAVCLVVGVFLSQYLGDAFGIINRFFNEHNTRTIAWSQMLVSIGNNPFFGHVADNASVYQGETVGEGGFLMAMSLFGIVGALPLFMAFGMLGRELLQLYRIRKIIPELSDLVDLSMSFWAALIVANVFESFLISYFTNVMLMVYTFFVIQGFIVDYGKQALAERQGALPVIQFEEAPYSHYAVS